MEYPLRVRSAALVWRFIAHERGLERWLADHVADHGLRMTFTWGEAWTERDVRAARVIERSTNSHIRLRWESGDHADDEYWELRIGRSELTGLLCLRITDFAAAGEEESLRGVWAQSLGRLHRASGL